MMYQTFEGTGQHTYACQRISRSSYTQSKRDTHLFDVHTFPKESRKQSRTKEEQKENRERIKPFDQNPYSAGDAQDIVCQLAERSAPRGDRGTSSPPKLSSNGSHVPRPADDIEVDSCCDVVDRYLHRRDII